MDIIQLISAAGLGGIIGSLLTTIVQSWLSNRSYRTNRSFQEKKEAYVGLLDSFRILLVERNTETEKNVGYWQSRIDLVGSNEVRETLENMTNKDTPNTDRHMKELRDAMRKDLDAL